MVEVHYYEGRTFELINAKTGVVTEIGDVPIFSPDRKHFVIVIGAYGDLNSVEVWLFDPTKIKREFTYEPYDWHDIIAKWSSSSSVDLFDRDSSSENESPAGKALARITCKNGEWKILQSPK